MHKRGNIFWGILLIILAALLLLRQMEIISGNIFGYFWPLLIIALGLSLIIGFFDTRRTPVEGEKVTIPLAEATSASIKINHGAGRVNLHAGTAAGELINGTFGNGLEYKSKVEGGRLEVKMRPRHQFWIWWPGESLNWDFTLSRDIPIILDIDSGASTSTLDLSELKITHLDIDTGASTFDLTLPANAGSTRVDIDAGASTLKITVPAGVVARIQTKTGLATVSVDQNRFPRIGSGLYQSTDYATAANRADITIDAGVGTIEIK